MQTFLPLPSFADSLRCLDQKRLGKQRVEAAQLVRAITGGERSSEAPDEGIMALATAFASPTGWANHPAAKMWRGHIPALKHYHNTSIMCWLERGYKNTMTMYRVDPNEVVYPPWFGDPAFHASHRSNLLRKNPEFYGRYGWNEPHDMEYVWAHA